ncbi:MAG: HPF/RaiA family ribosome-associated protein [Myxococcales bacterium]
MKVQIQGKHLKLTDELKGYVQDRLVKPLTRFYDDSAAELRVEFGDTNGPKGGLDKECHLTLHMPNARTLQIEESTNDCYASLDAAADRLIRICHRELRPHAAADGAPQVPAAGDGGRRGRHPRWAHRGAAGREGHRRGQRGGRGLLRGSPKPGSSQGGNRR